MTDARKYSDEEVRAILDRALKGDGGDASALSHAELLAIGEQVGVAPEAMSRAAEEVLHAKLDSAAERSIASRRKRWLLAHAVVFAVINGLLFAVNALTTPGEWWVLFPVVFWGLALALHAGLAVGVRPSARAMERARRRLQQPGRTPTARVRVAPAVGEQAESEPLESERELEQQRRSP
jgi:hypothetical protein